MFIKRRNSTSRGFDWVYARVILCCPPKHSQISISPKTSCALVGYDRPLPEGAGGKDRMGFLGFLIGKRQSAVRGSVQMVNVG